MKVYVICPVTNLTKYEKKKIDAYVLVKEKQGHKVRLPYRDTNQDDDGTGLRVLRIVEEHEYDIIWADEVHVWWNPTSEGSFWDLAQTWMAKRFIPEKEIVLINVVEVDFSQYRDSENAILALKSVIPLLWDFQSKVSLCQLAQARMAKRFEPERKVVLLNLSEIEVTPESSRTNLALATHFELPVGSTRQDLLDAISKAQHT